jgi:hypothetical protein
MIPIVAVKKMFQNFFCNPDNVPRRICVMQNLLLPKAQSRISKNLFWACGVTSQLAATSAPLSRVITHAPGHMFVSDLKDEDLTIL